MHRICRYFVSLACGAGALIGAAAGPSAFEPPIAGRLDPDFIRFFDTLALTEDYGPFNNRPPWVRKWEGPVQIVLDPSAEKLRSKIEILSSRLAGWTELPFVVMPEGTAVDADARNIIAVKLLDRADFMRTFNTRDVVCQTETHGVGGQLQVGYMVLSDGYTDCLRHEFMHALGFDSHWYPQHASEIKSVLAYRESTARAGDYTPWDVMAIRILYDGRIRAGMSRQRSLRIAHEVVGSRPQSAALPVVRRQDALYR